MYIETGLTRHTVDTLFNDRNFFVQEHLHPKSLAHSLYGLTINIKPCSALQPSTDLLARSHQTSRPFLWVKRFSRGTGGRARMVHPEAPL